ncbi:hypothetical protein EV426DRAFT_643245 [Tirmania nivea]|nr:hypothetical protein EV426DRAFT_643245 [Tirmania nivea]
MPKGRGKAQGAAGRQLVAPTFDNASRFITPEPQQLPTPTPTPAGPGKVAEPLMETEEEVEGGHAVWSQYGEGDLNSEMEEWIQGPMAQERKRNGEQGVRSCRTKSLKIFSLETAVDELEEEKGELRKVRDFAREEVLEARREVMKLKKKLEKRGSEQNSEDLPFLMDNLQEEKEKVRQQLISLTKLRDTLTVEGGGREIGKGSDET